MKFSTLVYLIIFFMVSCGKKESAVPTPSKPELQLPENNSACLTGTVISESESSINFTWSSSTNTNNYDLIIKNLLNNKIDTYPSSSNQITIKLLRDTPYSWYVVAKTLNKNVNSQSDTWRFYNSGLSATSHPPFPSDLISPKLGDNIVASAVSLVWKTNDVDNDIVAYDVYFGPSSYPLLFKSNIKDLFLNNISVIKGVTYYWKVIAKDSKGNSSESQLYQFNVNN